MFSIFTFSSVFPHLHSHLYWSRAYDDAFLWQIFDPQLTLKQNIDRCVQEGFTNGQTHCCWLNDSCNQWTEVCLWLTHEIIFTSQWSDLVQCLLVCWHPTLHTDHFTVSLSGSGPVYQPHFGVLEVNACLLYSSVAAFVFWVSSPPSDIMGSLCCSSDKWGSGTNKELLVLC